MDNYETTTTILAIRPKARGRNVPLRRMLANLSKLSVDGTQFFDTFTLFPRLQPELRQLIWAHACFQPRAVMLFVATDPHDLIPNRTYPGQRKLPAVLETCKESRDEALKHYTKTQEWVFSQPTPIFLAPGTLPANEQPFQPIQFPQPHVNTMYVNFSVDRFQHRNVIPRLLQESRFSPTGTGRLFVHYHFSHVSSIRILDQAHDFNIQQPMIQTLRNFFDTLVGLKELTYVLRLRTAPTYWLRIDDSLDMQLLVNDVKAEQFLPDVRSIASPAHIRRVNFNAFVSLPGGLDLAPVGLTDGLYDSGADISANPAIEL